MSELIALMLTAMAWASPEPWPTALPPDAVASYVTGAGVKVLVAGAGGEELQREQAAAQVASALRSSAAVKLVLGDDALGDLTAAADDASIVAMAGAQPVDQVFVVRVFPTGADWSVVVTMYEHGGAAIGGFSATTAEPLAVHQASPSSGMIGAAAAAVASVTNDASLTNEAAVKAFEERALWFQSWASVSSTTGTVVSTWSVPMGGRYGEALYGPKFYDYIGRDDLAEQWRRRFTTKNVIGWSGFGVMAAGATYAFIHGTRIEDPGFDDCYGDDPCVAVIEASNAEEKKPIVVGSVIGGVGFVTMVVAGGLNVDRSTRQERLRLADEFNADLRQELGLAEPTAELARRPQAQVFGSGWWVPGSAGGGTLSVQW